MKKSNRVTIFFPVIKGTAIRDSIKRGVLHNLAARIRKAGKKPFFVFLVLEKRVVFKDEVKGLDYDYITIPNIPWDNSMKHFFFRKLKNFLFSSFNDVSTYNMVMKERRRKHPLFYIAHRTIQLSAKPKFMKNLYNWILRRIERLEIFLTANIDKSYEKMFDKYNPDLLLFHSYQDINLIPIERVAKRRHIPFITSVMSWDNLTSNGNIPIKPDKLILWSELMKKEALAYHDFKPRDLYIAGPMQFDYHTAYADRFHSKEDFFRQMGLDLNKKTIAYTTASPLLFPEEPQFVDYLYRLVQERYKGKVQILVRVYSKDIVEGEKRYAFLKGRKDLIIDFAGKGKKLLTDMMAFDDETFIHLSETVKYSDLVMNFISTVNLDAFIFDKPVINVSFEGDLKKPYLKSVRRFQDYSHSQYMYRMKGSVFAENEQQLVRALDGYLKNPAKDRLNRRRTLNAICGNIDCKASERIANFVFNELEERKIV